MSDYGQRDYQKTIKCTCNQTLMLIVQFRYVGNSWAVRAKHKNSLRYIFCTVRTFAVHCRLNEISFSIEVAPAVFVKVNQNYYKY